MVNEKVRGLIMFLTGGIVYFYFEIFVRGYSHISMFILGGICFFIVGKVGNLIINRKEAYLIKILMIMLVSCIVITSLEFATGMIVNVNMELSVWDYSHMKYNFMGQICLLYSMLWSLLGLPCVYFYWMINTFILDGGVHGTAGADVEQAR